MFARLTLTNYMKHSLRKYIFYVMNFACKEFPDKKEIGEAFVESIMKEYLLIDDSEGMGVLRDVVSLEGTGTSNVVIRSITEKFWKEVIDATRNGYRVCAVGTPGIGKTTTTCILIRQLLLEEKKTVVYHILGNNNDGYVYMFIPPVKDSRNFVVKVIRENEFDYADSNVNNDSVYYVVDPGKNKNKSCDLNNDYRGKLIIVASPHDAHWGKEEFSKIRLNVKAAFLFYPVWSINELIYANPFFDINFDNDVIYNRYEEVGGIPRFIFTSQDDYEAVLLRQKNAINCLSDEQVRQLTLNNADAAQTFGSNEPKSIIMVYNCPNMIFKKYSVAVSSRRVTRLLVERKMNVLWNSILQSDSTSSFATWQIFETYCQNLMLGDNTMKFYDYKYHDGTRLIEATDVSRTPLHLGGCSKIKGTQQNLFAAAKRQESEHVLFYSLNTRNEFIDFLYRKGRTIYAFQVTIGKGHSCSPDQFNAAFQEIGNDYEFFLYYLTYVNQYKSFQLTPANPYASNSNNNIPPKSSNWTLQVIRVPAPNEEHLGPTMSDHINSLTVAQLKSKLHEMGIIFDRKSRKNELIELVLTQISKNQGEFP
jgi:HeH/LEM domain/Retrotransposon hot spot protein